MKISKLLSVFILCLLLISLVHSQEKKIYWGDDVPSGWNGNWPEKFQTPAEKSEYTETASNDEILEFISTLKWNSENMYVFNMFVSDLGRNCPVVVMANPVVTSARDAKASGKTIIYLQGAIHPDESEGKDALLILMRDILLGEKKYLLDKLVILCCPNFNVDGTESWAVQDRIPMLAGIRQNARGFDINRDAIKLETTNMQQACRSVFNTWDPTIILDTHRMGRARHGYSIGYATSTVPAAYPGPRNYVTDELFPAVRQMARDNGSIEIFYHAGLDRNWPPREFTHDRAIWSVEGKFMASGYGLRNRMSIIVETPGPEIYQKAMYSTYIFARELLEYTYRHGEQMQQICRQADEEIVNNIRTQAQTGQLKNYVAGKYESVGKVDLYAYEKLETGYLPGTSIRKTGYVTPVEPPVLCSNVDLVIKPVGTKQATVPRGYLIAADMDFIVEKLRIHNIEVNVFDKPVTVSGEEFIIDKIVPVRKGGYDMTELQGGFYRSQRKEFPAGTFQVDLAQPLANLAFYCREPEVGDGFAGWNLMNEYLYSLGVKDHSVVYPVYKYLQILE
jgi:hypothetical protein